MSDRMDAIGQNGNDGYHYDILDKELNKRSQILDKAKKIINGERQKDYGSPEDNFEKIASFWSDYLKENLSAKDVAMMMILLKVARMSTGSGTADCLIDICGYAALAAELN